MNGKWVNCVWSCLERYSANTPHSVGCDMSSTQRALLDRHARLKKANYSFRCKPFYLTSKQYLSDVFFSTCAETSKYGWMIRLERKSIDLDKVVYKYNNERISVWQSETDINVVVVIVRFCSRADSAFLQGRGPKYSKNSLDNFTSYNIIHLVFSGLANAVCCAHWKLKKSIVFASTRRLRLPNVYTNNIADCVIRLVTRIVFRNKDKTTYVANWRVWDRPIALCMNV